jgi:DUF4097 and DUF4098 domain-containing protein YvlB
MAEDQDHRDSENLEEGNLEEEGEVREEESSEEEDAYTPPSKDEWKKTRAALKKANAEAKKHRLAARQAKEKQNDDPEEIVKARQEVTDYWKPLYVKSQAKVALKEAGLDAKPERLLNMLDMESLEVDEESGEISGLEDQVNSLKEEYPQLFKSNRTTTKVDAGDKRKGIGSSSTNRSSAERLAESL